MSRYRILICFICLLLLSPFIALFISIIFSSSSNGVLESYPIIKNITYTFSLLFLSAFGAGSIGLTCAWLLSYYHFFGSRFLSWALILPLAIPPYLLAMSYAEILDYAGIIQTTLRSWFGFEQNLWSIRSLIGASLIFSFSLFPYVYLFSRSIFLTQSKQLIEVAELSGLNRFHQFTKVILPMAAPSIVVSILLVSMEVLADYGVVSYYGVYTLSSVLFRTWFGIGDFSVASTIAIYLFLIATVLLIIDRLFRRKLRYYQSDISIIHQNPVVSQAFDYPILGFMVVFLPLLFGFIIPVIIFISWLDSTMLFSYEKYFTTIFQTLLISLIATIFILLTTLLLIYLKRITKVKGFLLYLISFATSGYAMPGLMIAVSVMILISGIQWFFEKLGLFFNFEINVWLGGGFFVLFFALIVRFLTGSFNILDLALSQISPSLDESARLMGAKTRQIAKLIHSPLLKPSLIASICLLFIEIAKELPLIIALRPFGIDTLSSRIWELASDERIFEIAPYALSLILILTLFGYLGQKFISQKKSKPI